MVKDNSKEYKATVTSIKLFLLFVKNNKNEWISLNKNFCLNEYRINLQDVMQYPSHYTLEELKAALKRIHKKTPNSYIEFKEFIDSF